MTMTNIIGYTLSGQDNDSYMFEDDSCLEKCDMCGYRIDFSAYNPEYRLARKTQRDITATYDGQWIVSDRLRLVCEANGVADVLFRPFNKEPRFFQFISTRVVPFDVERRKTRFIKLCPKCGNYESIAGATPAYLKITKALDFGIYRTDVLFGSGNEKHPLIIVAPDVKEIFELEKLRGLEFGPVIGQ